MRRQTIKINFGVDWNPFPVKQSSSILTECYTSGKWVICSIIPNIDFGDEGDNIVFLSSIQQRHCWDKEPYFLTEINILTSYSVFKQTIAYSYWIFIFNISMVIFSQGNIMHHPLFSIPSTNSESYLTFIITILLIIEK